MWQAVLGFQVGEEWGSSVWVAKAEGLGAKVRFEGVGGG